MKSMKTMNRLWRTAFLTSILAGALTVSTQAYTLMVAPARYSVLQVAFDILARSPSVLVSYQVKPGSSEPVLHAWNGTEWVYLSEKDYREGNFLQKVPDRVVLMGDDGTLPTSVLDASTWVSEVVRIRDLNTRSLVNEFGHLLQWRSADWKWFAQRYNLDLRDESEARRNSSWYDQPGPLPNRPHILERITEGPARDAQPVPVVEAEEAPMEAVDAVAPVEPVVDAPAEAPADAAPATP